MDVMVWLRSLGLGQYEAVFRQNEIDETVLPNLTADFPCSSCRLTSAAALADRHAPSKALSDRVTDCKCPVRLEFTLPKLSSDEARNLLDANWPLNVPFANCNAPPICLLTARAGTEHCVSALRLEHLATHNALPRWAACFGPACASGRIGASIRARDFASSAAVVVPQQNPTASHHGVVHRALAELAGHL
jgi:SAM domain (Sterile alpha motif)